MTDVLDDYREAKVSSQVGPSPAVALILLALSVGGLIVYLIWPQG